MANTETLTDRRPDAALVKAFQDGDTEAAGELYRRHFDAVIRTCRSRTMSEVDAEDAAQETFARGLAVLPRFDGGALYGHWLQRVAVTVCADFTARREHTTDNGHLPEQEHFPSSEAAEDPSQAIAVAEVLNQLNPRDRTALVLRDMYALPIDMVAKRLSVTKGSARVLLCRARKRLRKECETRNLRPLVLGANDVSHRFRSFMRHQLAAAFDSKIAAIAGGALAAVAIFGADLSGSPEPQETLFSPNPVVSEPLKTPISLQRLDRSIIADASASSEYDMAHDHDDRQAAGHSRTNTPKETDPLPRPPSLRVTQERPDSPATTTIEVKEPVTGGTITVDIYLPSVVDGHLELPTAGHETLP